MTTIKLSTMKSAATLLKSKAKQLDKNHDGVLAGSELTAGRAKVGDVTVHAINKFKASMYGNRWSGATTPVGLKVSALNQGIDLAVKQLKAVDKNKDGTVTPAEIKSYPHGQGVLQHFAQQLVWYAKNK